MLLHGALSVKMKIIDSCWLGCPGKINGRRTDELLPTLLETLAPNYRYTLPNFFLIYRYAPSIAARAL